MAQPATQSKPLVMIIGGKDVNARIGLMDRLRTKYDFVVLGSSAEIEADFRAKNYDYRRYYLANGINPLGHLKTFLGLIRLMKAIQPDIIHTFDTKQSIWGRYAAILARMPIIIATITGLGSLYSSETTSTRLIRAIYELFQKIACHRSHLTIFQNKSDYQTFIEKNIVPADKASVILGSGIDTSYYNPTQVTQNDIQLLREELGINPSHRVVTLISRLIYAKGIMNFCDVANSLSQIYPDTHFLLVGEYDADNEGALSFEDFHNVQKSVQWIGQRKDIRTILAITHIVVLASIYREGIPRVLMEAASMEKPCITLDTAGCNDIIHNRVNGLLLDRLDNALLETAIIGLLDDKTRQRIYGKAGRVRAIAEFDIALVAQQLDEAYIALLNPYRRERKIKDNLHGC